MKSSIFSHLLSFVLALSVALPPQLAVAGPNFRLAGELVKVAGKEFKVLTSFGANKLKQGTTVELVDLAGNVTRTIFVPIGQKITSDAALPTKIAEQIIEKRKSLGSKAGKLIVEQLIRLPVESFSFFLALGAVVAQQIIFNYSQDPLAVDHLINNQSDPVSTVSFFAFMLANQGTTQAFQSAFEKNGKLSRRRAFILQNMGMSVGMLASNIVGEALHSPNFLACTGKVLTAQGFSSKACDDAAVSWHEKGGSLGFLEEWAPGLAALATTSMIMTVGQAAADRVITISAVDIATLLVPGGFEVDAVRAVGFAMAAANMAVFTEINNAVQSYYTMMTQNYWQSGAFNELEKSIVTDLSLLPQKNWQGKHLNDNLSTFSKAMKAWRAMNLTDVNMAQSNWIENLNNFAGLYNVSHEFYTDIVSDLVKKKEDPTYSSPLDRNFPLNGIKLKDWNKEKVPYPFFAQPDDVFSMQLDTVRYISKWADHEYGNEAFLATLSAHNRREMKEILAGLRSTDVKAIGQSIDLLNLSIQQYDESIFSLDGSYYKILKSIRNELGKPKPIWEKSAGYVHYLLMGPKWSGAEHFSHPSIYWYNHFTYTYAHTMSDWLMASLVWGPDAPKGETMNGDGGGFHSQFLAPRMPLVPNTAETCPNNPNLSLDKFGFCENGTTYDNPLDLVVHRIRPELVNDETFSRWWQQYPETSYVTAWADYENKYQDIVIQLTKKMWTGKTSSANRGDIAPGLMDAAIQEWKVYAITLGGLIQTHLDQAGQVDVLRKLLSPYANESLTKINVAGNHANFFESLLMNNNLDLKTMLQNQNYGFITVSPSAYPQSHNFGWQNKLLTQIDWELSQLTQQMKTGRSLVLNDGGKLEVLTSQVTNEQFQAKQKEIQTTLDIVAKLVASLGMTPEQQQTAKLCLDNISAVVQEMVTTAEIANSVSYRELLNNHGELAPSRCTTPQGSGGSNGMQFTRTNKEGCKE